jgi:hypothetical protein
MMKEAALFIFFLETLKTTAFLLLQMQQIAG